MRKLPETMQLDNMRSMVLHFPQMLQDSSLDQELIQMCRNYHKERIKGICFLGMGGSSIVGSYVREILKQKSPLPLDIVRNYFLPEWISKDWVVVAVSYSGNTEETLASLAQAEERGSKILIITSGGKMAKDFSHYPQVLVQDGIQPRAALPLMLSKALPISEALIGVPTTDLNSISENLTSASKNWGKSIPAPSVIAERLHNRIPLFIGAQHLSPVAYRAKCQINENSKAEAFNSEIPEANHNEIEGFPNSKKTPVTPVFLRSKDEDIRIRQRMDIAMNLYSEIGLNPINLNSIGRSKTESMLTLTHYLDMVSVELAEKRGIDAVDVKRIRELKTRLASKG